MKLAVTGGAGFIGSHVVDCLKAEGHEVVVIDFKAKPHRSDVIFEDTDILDLAGMVAVTKGCDAIFHLAAVSNVNYAYKHPVYTVNLNIVGTANVLEAARINGIGRVIFASTVWVYTGTRNDGLLHEDVPFYIPDAGHVYTTSKIASEMLIHNYWQLYQQPFTILRYGIPYGPRMRDELVIPIFVRKALRGEPITITGDGSQYRNYIYVEDLASAHILALSDQAKNQTYNLEGPKKITIKDIVDTIALVLGKDLQVEYLPARPGDYRGKEVSAEKAKRELGWAPKVDFVEGMRRYIEWYKTNKL